MGVFLAEKPLYKPFENKRSRFLLQWSLLDAESDSKMLWMSGYCDGLGVGVGGLDAAL